MSDKKFCLQFAECGSDIELVADLQTTVEGKALDATMGKLLDDKIAVNTDSIDTINHNLIPTTLNTQFTDILQVGEEKLVTIKMGNLCYLSFTADLKNYAPDQYNILAEFNDDELILNKMQYMTALLSTDGEDDIPVRMRVTTSKQLEVYIPSNVTPIQLRCCGEVFINRA